MDSFALKFVIRTIEHDIRSIEHDTAPEHKRHFYEYLTLKMIIRFMEYDIYSTKWILVTYNIAFLDTPGLFWTVVDSDGLI